MKCIFWAQTLPDDALFDGFWTLISRENGARALAGLIAYVPEVIRYRARWVGALLKSALPIALIDGMCDPISGTHTVRHYRELVRNPQITELEAIGHYPQIEAPKAVVAACLAFHASMKNRV